MAVRLSRTAGLSLVGDLWVFAARVQDLDGYATDAETPAITITRPDGTTTAPAVERLDVGCWRFTYTAAAAGRHLIAAATTSYGQAKFAQHAAVATTQTGMPTLVDWQAYAGGEFEISWDDDEITGALAAESAAQRARLRPSAVYSDDVREALYRRVTCNLARRRLPLGVQTGDADAGPVFLPLRDPEVRRLEAPYRKMVFG